MQKVIYQNKGGLGIILNKSENEKDFFGNKEFTINGTTIKAGDYTDLFGLFTEPVKYVGNLLENENCMVFLLGDNSDLFNQITYYSCFYWITETRLANKYTHTSVRDFNWVNNTWK